MAEVRPDESRGLTHTGRRWQYCAVDLIDTPEHQVRQALKTAASVTEAAVLLGVSRRTMYRLMRKYGIEIRRIVA